MRLMPSPNSAAVGRGFPNVVAAVASILNPRWDNDSFFLVKNLTGFPRHLSQHVGGMVMTAGSLCELCPIENAAMEGRTVIPMEQGRF